MGLTRQVLPGQDALRERAPDDLADALPGAEREDLRLRLAGEEQILGLARDEALARERQGVADLPGDAPVRVRVLPLPDGPGERLHRLGERGGRVVPVALVQVDVVGAQPPERGVELLLDLGRRQAAVPRSGMGKKTLVAST